MHRRVKRVLGEPVGGIGTNSFGRSATFVGLLMGLGVLATLVREILLAHLFGTGSEIERFRLAFAIPNLLGTSLATVVVAALSPMLSRHDADPGSQAEALRQSVAATIALGVSLGVLGILTAPWQANVMAPGYSPNDREALTPVFMLLWAFFIITACSFGPRAFLSHRGVVWPMASSNLILGGVMALGIVVLAVLPGSTHTAANLALVAIGAAALLLAIHVVALPRATLRLIWRRPADGAQRNLISSWTTLLIVLAGHLLSAAPRLVDRAAATDLLPGAVAAMDYSFSIITVPGIAFGSVFVIAALPRFASALRDRDDGAVRALAVLAAASAALAALFGLLLNIDTVGLVKLIFARGAFDAAAVAVTSTLVSWHAMALGPMVASLILAQAMLSAGLVNAFLLVSVLRVVLKVIAVTYLVPSYGLDGLAASFLVPELASAAVFLGILLVHFRSRAIA